MVKTKCYIYGCVAVAKYEIQDTSSAPMNREKSYFMCEKCLMQRFLAVHPNIKKV